MDLTGNPGLIDQINNDKPYSKLSIEILESLTSHMYFQPQVIQLYTGKGGCKEFIKEYLHSRGEEYNFRNVRRAYTSLRKSGRIQIFKY